MVILQYLCTHFLGLVLLSLLLGSAGAGLAGPPSVFGGWSLASWGWLQLEFTWILDASSYAFLFTISAIASSIFLFSNYYMASEKFFLRFHLILWMFVLSMLLLIISPNLVSLLLGWDGLGVTSYLLVVYYQSTKAYNAGMITALSNRVGDALLLVVIGLMAPSGAWCFHTFSLANYGLSAAAGCLAVAACCTKSAQIPFSAWLPAAMAAPTPVSSLVHSSTLVTAGVYLAYRFFPALVGSLGCWCLLFLGASTMLMAGLAAIAEMDMKKVVALSTLSQLGVMTFSLGSGMPSASFFHLISHAFFKALLFMTIGAAIHEASDYQDMRKASLNLKQSPLTFAFNLTANLSLCGLPFLAGFYSKDLCIEGHVAGSFPFATSTLLYAATALTAAYSYRLVMSSLWGFSSLSPSAWSDDKSPTLNYSMLGLFVLAVVGGVPLGWGLFSSPPTPFLPIGLKALTLGCITGGVTLGWHLSKGPNPGTPQPVLTAMWGIPPVSVDKTSLLPLQGGAHLRALGEQSWGYWGLVGFSLPIGRQHLSSGPTAPPWAYLGLIVTVCMMAQLYLCVMDLSILCEVKVRSPT